MKEDHIEHDPGSAPVLKHSIVSARAWDRYSFMDERGRPATLAIIDQDGKVLDSGPEVAREIWDIAILAYRRYLKGEAFRTIISGPMDFFRKRDARFGNVTTHSRHRPIRKSEDGDKNNEFSLRFYFCDSSFTCSYFVT